MIMKIAVGFPTPLQIGVQPVIVHNLKFSLTSISKRGFLSFIDQIIERVNKETDIPCIKGSAHLPKEYSLKTWG